MSTTTVYLTGDALSADYVNFYGPFLIKGTSTVGFNLYGVNEETNPVANIHGYFGDGTEYQDVLNLHIDLSSLDTIEIAESGKIRCIAQNFEHIYEKNQTTFVEYLTASFALTYTSQRRGIHNVGLIHVKNSYYDDVKQIHLNATQMLPISSNDLVAVASDDSGNVFHMYISRTQLESADVTLTTPATGVFLGPRTIKNCYILQAQQGGVIVPLLST